MGNYKFYTPPLLADCLIKCLPKQRYNNVIDICCGSWNLLRAAKKKYKDANYTGVDIDPEARGHRFKGARFKCLDGREYANKEGKRFDLVLSNPPFGRLEEDERYYTDSAKAVVKELNNKRYENEMMQANLLLSKAGGVLLFILPATFFEGDTFGNIRKSLCNKYNIESVIKLPLETFGNSRIRSYAMIMHNIGEQRKRAMLEEAVFENNMWKINHRRYLSIQQMKSGCWVTEDSEYKKKVGIEIYRGNISSADMSKKGRLVLHSSSALINGEWYPSTRYCNDNEKLLKAKTVSPGDIIVNRIGRFARHWCVCKKEAYVSDCLIVIRSDNISTIYDKLCDATTEGRLNISTKGVATRYITMKDIKKLL